MTSGSERAMPRSRMALAIVMMIALIVRLPLITREFAAHYDEIWQYLEPAYGLDFGRSIVAWEYRVGVRRWLIPMFLAPPLWLGERLGEIASFPLLPLRLMLIMLSLTLVWAAYRIGERLSRFHAVAASMAMALAFEPIFMAGRALSEAIGTSLLAVALVPLLPGGRGGARAWAAGGACAALAVACRLQSAPAVGVLVLLCCGGSQRKWFWTAAGGGAALALSGLCDAINGQVPFRWMVENFRLNLLEHVSEQYGVAPATQYLADLARYCGPVAPLLALLVAAGARRQPILLAVALVHLAVHSLIPHKEYRFIFPSIALFVLLAGLGAGEALKRIAAWRPARVWLAAALLGLVGLGASAAATIGARRDYRFGFVPSIAMWRTIHRRADLCAIASYRIGRAATAYAYIDRPYPIYMFLDKDAPALPTAAHAFDAVQAFPAAAAALTPLGYRAEGCFPAGAVRPGMPPPICLFVRPGGCDPRGAEYLLENRVRARSGF